MTKLSLPQLTILSTTTRTHSPARRMASPLPPSPTTTATTRPRRPPNPDTTISKALSYVLRHGASKENLPLTPDGWANVPDLVPPPFLPPPTSLTLFSSRSPASNP